MVGGVAFVVQYNWRGTRREWEAYERAHPNFRHQWNGELDHVSICDLGDPHLICPALRIYPVGALDEQLAEAAAARAPVTIAPGLEQFEEEIRSGPQPGTIEYERFTRQRIMGFVRVRPEDASRIQTPSLTLTYTIPDNEWHEQAGLIGLTQQLLFAASQNREASVVALYMPRAPESWEQRVADRIEVGNYMIHLHFMVARADYRARQGDFDRERLGHSLIMTEYR